MKDFSKLTKKDVSYEEWMKHLDKHLQDISGMGVDDGVDFPSRDTYDEGKTISQAIKIWKKYQF